MNKKDMPERLFLMMKVALAQLVLRERMKRNKVKGNNGMKNNFESQEQISKEDFKEYVKKEFNQNVEFVKSDNPDTVESLFGPTERPISETIRPVAFDEPLACYDSGWLEEEILNNLNYMKELEKENKDLRELLAKVYKEVRDLRNTCDFSCINTISTVLKILERIIPQKFLEEKEIG